MVTAEVKDGKPEEERDYPYLGIADNGLIVLFTSKNTGSAVGVGMSVWPMGEHKTIWAEESFTPFTGSVTLRNG